MVGLKLKLNDKEALKNLVCEDIPDVRKMQRMRLDSIGYLSSGEQYMEKYYRQDKFEKTPRLIRIPSEELREVYSLALPLTFPMLDQIKGGGFGPSYSRWQHNGGGGGAMHLTTKRGLSRLLGIFAKNNLPVKEESAFGPVFDFLKDNRKWSIVPHSWYVDTYDPYENLFTHQFVACEQKVIGIPYYYVEKITRREESRNKFLTQADSSFTDETTKDVNYHAEAVFVNSEQAFVKQYKERILGMLRSWNQRKTKEFNKISKTHHTEYSSIRLLNIGEPVLIYDPEWIKSL